MTGRSWRLEHREPPMSENEHRTLHWRERYKFDQYVKKEFGWLARLARMPKGIPHPVHVTAVQLVRPGVTLADAGNCYPTVKAAIDGLVEVGALIDDGPAHVVAVTLAAAARSDHDALLLIVEEIPEETPA